MMTITSRIRESDRTLVQVHADGGEEVLTKQPFRPMTDAEVRAAALSDPDAQLLTAEQLAHIKPMPRAKTILRALRLTQEEFAARYHIPLGTLRDWEQGRAQPDQPARAYLRAIAGDAQGVQRALETRPT
jgi:putative transcriptional regulator